jgi:hypothetical protein
LLPSFPCANAHEQNANFITFFLSRHIHAYVLNLFVLCFPLGYFVFLQHHHCYFVLLKSLNFLKVFVVNFNPLAISCLLGCAWNPQRKLLKDVVSLLKLFLVDTTAVGFDSGWLQPAGQFSPTNLLMLLIKALKLHIECFVGHNSFALQHSLCFKIQASSSSSAIVWHTRGPLLVKFFGCNSWVIPLKPSTALEIQTLSEQF